MTQYAAKINPVTRITEWVIVGSPEWANANLEGEWVQGGDFENPDDPKVYPGIGYGYDPTFPEAFAIPWEMPVQDPETGEWPLSQGGELRFHTGRIWRNILPAGTPNVWEPPINWREVPLVGLPEWVQPTGAGDAYNIADPGVMHLSVGWRSKIDANTTEPGSDPRWWELIDPPDVEPEPVAPQPWQPWDGIRPLYQVGAVVTHLGQTWESTVPNNSWEPGAPDTAALWTPVA